MGNIKDELMEQLRVTDIEWLSSTSASVTLTDGHTILQGILDVEED